MDLMRTLLSHEDFRELETMSNRLNRILSEGGKSTRRPDETVAGADWMPVVDILETDDNFQIHVELPGIEKNAVKLSIEKGVLLISGERPQGTLSEGMRYHRNERPYGRFERAFRVPDSVDEQKLEADLQNGILTVRLPKVEKAKPKSIHISVA
ncbi:MAG: Hsp20/alpha crystallin family protein [Nitrospira sp.]|nr:Hsp20/alpha crystallin family protein [Nitrospira sp.]